jgi:predicted aldo/keto reductase-like oxidoreductase
MRYNQLGRTDLIVSELCLGTMTFGGEAGMWAKIGQLGQDEADTLVKAALDAGINFSTPPTSTRKAGPKRSSAARSVISASGAGRP